MVSFGCAVTCMIVNIADTVAVAVAIAVVVAVAVAVAVAVVVAVVVAVASASKLMHLYEAIQLLLRTHSAPMNSHLLLCCSVQPAQWPSAHHGVCSDRQAVRQCKAVQEGCPSLQAAHHG